MNLEGIFVREFKRSVRVVGSRDIYRVPLPKECASWNISGCNLYGVKGIEEPYFESLNYCKVKQFPKKEGYRLQRRIIDPATRKFKLKDGKPIYEPYKVPTGSEAVISTKKIDLPHERRHTPSNGYGYVDFVESREGLNYIYILPRENLYLANQTALALSVKNMKNFMGMGYRTWDNGNIFLHVIPYNPNAKYTGSRILATKVGLNYSTMVEFLVKYWQSINFIPQIVLCGLSNGTNIGVIPTTVGYDDYIPIEPLAIGEKLDYTG